MVSIEVVAEVDIGEDIEEDTEVTVVVTTPIGLVEGTLLCQY